MKSTLAGACPRRCGGSGGRRRADRAAGDAANSGNPPRHHGDGRGDTRPGCRSHHGRRGHSPVDRERRAAGEFGPDGSGPRGPEARRRRGSRRADELDQPQSRISLPGKPAAAAGRLHRLEPGQHPLPRHPQQRADPRRSGRRGRQPDQRPVAHDRQAGSGARRGPGSRRSPTAGLAPSSTPARWASVSPASSRSARAGEAIRSRLRCR